MSGRDLRKLVASHRQGKFVSLTQRRDDLITSITSGSHRPKHFSDVNYDQVLTAIKEKKEESYKQSSRVKQLVRHGKERKKASILKEHRKVWLKTFADLKQKVSICQLEMEQWKSDSVLNESSLMLQDVLLEMLELSNTLQTDRLRFEQESRKPVQLLKREINKSKRSVNLPLSNENLFHKLNKVREKQEEAWLSLQAEWMLLYNEYQPIEKEMMSYVNKYPPVRGVAEEVWSLDCPSDELRGVMAEEFYEIQNHYQTQLDRLEEQLKECLKRYNGGFHSGDDRLHFDLIFEQYPPTQRSLCIDRMTTEIPHKTRQEIVAYEMQFCALKYYHKQKDVLENLWKYARQELVERTKQCFSQACEEWRQRKLCEKERSSHQLMCMKLAQKVTEWRQKCLSKQEAETTNAAKELMEQRASIEAEEKREKEKRKTIKQQLTLFHAQKVGEREREIARERERLDKRSTDLEQQSIIDKIRTDYRSELYQHKLHDQVSQREILEEENEKREERLEKLRRLVRVEATADLERLYSKTKSSKAHLLEAEVSCNNSLFPIHSFTSDKVLADKRIKVAEALREAGLLSTDYAQQVLASVSPPVQPRPDQASSLFKL